MSLAPADIVLPIRPLAAGYTPSMNLRITDVPLPVRLLYKTPLTDDELLQFSGSNEVVWIEREPDGALYVKPIWATIESGMFADVICDLGQWTEADGRGKMLGGCGYLLPDGSMRGSPVSWVLKERIAPFEQEGRDRYPRLAPDFIVEVMSVFDDPAYLRSKMVQWIANAVPVAWLIESDPRRVTIYRAGKVAEVLEDPAVVQGDGPVAGFELGMARVWG
jgi:Uma2 family endonuclease